MSEARHRVLVVDDVEDNIDLLRRRLERRGYDVETATNGPDALVAIQDRAIDLVILDVMMPGMSGLEVLERVRRTRSAQELPVIMATAKAESSDVIEALDRGANDYVVKPIDLEVLLARMRVCLRNVTPRAVKEAAEAIGPGRVLDRKYELDALIGVGGFGSVYRARHLALKKQVAVKFLHEHLLSSEKALRRFEQEGISACRVQHPNAVAILDAGTTAEEQPYLVMELLEGPTLGQELEREGVLRLARVASIASPLCAALDAAHREGIVHRDVKPANVVLSRDSRGEEVVKVLDFGIAKLVESHAQGLATVDEIAGTPQYMAPERLLGEGCDGRSDVYSVGVTVYVMLSTRMPFTYMSDNAIAQALQQVRDRPRSIAEVRPDLPHDVGRVLMASLERDPAARPALSELAGTLERFAASWTEPEWPPLVASDLPMALRATSRSGRMTIDGSTRAERPGVRADAASAMVARARGAAGGEGENDDEGSGRSSNHG